MQAQMNNSMTLHCVIIHVVRWGKWIQEVVKPPLTGENMR